MSIKKFSEINESDTDDKLTYIKKEQNVIKNVKDIIQKVYYSGFGHGLKKAGARGTYRLENLEFNLDWVDDLSLQQIQELIQKFGQESEEQIQKLY
jgi:hypothetical protein